MARLSRAVASGFGLGRIPAAPGTAASLAACLAGARVSKPMLAGFAAAVTIGGWVAARRAVRDREADPSWVVVDEIAGQWIAMLGAPAGSRVGAAAAFGLFRLLDIAKPGPVGWADRKGGAAGIMGDDIIAGALAACMLAAARRAAPRWRGWGC